MKRRTAVLVLMVLTISSQIVSGSDNTKKNRRTVLATSSVASTIIDANNLTSWIQADALWPPVVGESWNGEFPKGSEVGVVFQEGIMFGGLVYDRTYPSLRVDGSMYSTTMQAGKILTGSDGKVVGAENANDSTVARVWRVRPDYRTASLIDDAKAFFNEDSSKVTAQQIQQLRSNYESDWNDWPASKGAPYIDVNGDGKYEPDTDIPGVAEAAQTVWLVANDLDSALTTQLCGTPPIGIEEQITEWTWKIDGQTVPDNIVYKQVKLIYKGTTTSSFDSHIDGLYLSQWADPDVGDYSDDLVGSDSTLNLGYAYNGEAVDLLYQHIGLSPPAMGYQIISGPSYKTGAASDSAITDFGWKRGYRYPNPPMTAYVRQLPYYGLIVPWDDQAAEDYNMMRGGLPRPSYPAFIPAWTLWTTPGNHPTNYMCFGDPTTRSGWIDSLPGDRRFWCSNGPFDMKLGDTAEYVIAEVAAEGPEFVQNVNVLKLYARWSQFLFNTSASPSILAVKAPEQVPRNWILKQNYPNPFNPSTTIRYNVQKRGRVNLAVFNILGQKVRTLVDGVKDIGTYSVDFNGMNLPSGIYIYELMEIGASAKMKMMLLK